MTHDELLAEINLLGETSSIQSSLANALRTVLKLHKPSQEVGGGCDENGEELWVCGICPDGDGLQNYPCPTIKAIEKELA